MLLPDVPLLGDMNEAQERDQRCLSMQCG